MYNVCITTGKFRDSMRPYASSWANKYVSLMDQ
jgi:hypothetical protein